MHHAKLRRINRKYSVNMLLKHFSHNYKLFFSFTKAVQDAPGSTTTTKIY